MKGGLGGLMQKAQKLQEDMQKAQAELQNVEIEGQSGAGLVKVIMNGQHELKRVNIDDRLLNDDKDMLEDLVAAAVNDAVHKIADEKKNKMADVTSGIPMPPGFKMPF